jgi:hypothetical protein
MVVNGLLLAQVALPTAKHPGSHGIRDWMFSRREKSIDPTWIRTPWPSRYTEYANPGPLFYIALQVS